MKKNSTASVILVILLTCAYYVYARAYHEIGNLTVVFDLVMGMENEHARGWVLI